MENNFYKVNWEKISVYFASLTVILTLWSSLHQTQRDIADMRERIARVETKLEWMEKEFNVLTFKE
jgi:uncharacterized membrane protein